MTLFDQYAKARWRLAQYLEGKWWQRYLKAKSPAAYLDDKKRYWHKTLDQLDWELVPGRRSLDAGCGPAGIFIVLQDTEAVAAIDPLLDKYEEKLAIFSRQAYPRVSFHAQQLEAPVLAGSSFEAIYCFNAINHVADWDLAMDRLTEYAAPGTRMILTSDVHRHKILLPIFKALPGDALHPQQHGPEAYREALLSRGWEIAYEEVLREESIFNYTAWVAVYTGNTPNS